VGGGGLLFVCGCVFFFFFFFFFCFLVVEGKYAIGAQTSNVLVQMSIFFFCSCLAQIPIQLQKRDRGSD